VAPTVGEHACQVSAISEPLFHSVRAWLMTLCRLAMSVARNIMSPPHRPGHWPVTACTCAVYWPGWLAGSLLCWPETIDVPVIDRR